MGAVAIFKGLYAQILAASGIEFKDGTKLETYAGDPNGLLARQKGSVVLDTTNGVSWINTDGASAWANSVTLIGSRTGEPMGFENPDQWLVTYDSLTRTVTLTPAGTQSVFVRGKEFQFSAPVALAHADVTGMYFFQIDATGALVVGASFSFETAAPAALVTYDTTQTPKGWGLRETHGVTMDWATHREFHEKDGTYLVSGGGLTAATYTVYDPGSGTNPLLATIAPGVPTTLVADEDLRSSLAALADGGSYWKLRFDWVALKWLWVEDVSAPYYQTGNVPEYNPASGGAALASLVDDDYCCYYLLQIPASDDAGSQAFRHVWIPGQQKYAPALPNTAQRTIARDLALAEDPYAPGILLLEPLPSQEFVITAKIVVHYRTSFTNNDYRLRIEGYQKFNRTRTGGGGTGAAISLPAIIDSTVAITTASLTGGFDPSVETNQKLVNERVGAFGYAGDWVTLTDYRVGNVIASGSKLYRCETLHTSGVFYTDVASGYWTLLGDGGISGRVQTTDAVQTTLMSYTTASDTCVLLELAVTAFETTAGGDTKAVKQTWRLKNVAGALTTVEKFGDSGSEDAGAAAWGVTVDNVGDVARVRVTGEAGTDINWQGTASVTYF